MLTAMDELKDGDLRVAVYLGKELPNGVFLESGQEDSMSWVLCKSVEDAFDLRKRVMSEAKNYVEQDTLVKVEVYDAGDWLTWHNPDGN